MSMATLERAILKSAKIVLNNPALTMREICEWSTSEDAVKAGLQAGEIMVHIPDPGVWIAVNQKRDRRATS